MTPRRPLGISFIPYDSNPGNYQDKIAALEHRLRMVEENLPATEGGERDGNSSVDNTRIIVSGNTPIGGIIVWGLPIADIPEDWALCDGTNGTPDLRGVVVVGAGGAFAVGDTGGSATKDLEHTHGPGSLNTDNDSHTHDVTGTSSPESSHDHGISVVGTNFENTALGTDFLAARQDHRHGASTTTTDAHSHSNGSYATDNDTHDHDVDSGVTSTAGSTTQDILPPFHALAYIMRIA